MQKVISVVKEKTSGDRLIWIVLLLLSVFSLLAVYSSTGTLAYKYQAGNTEYYVIKHFIILALGIGIVFLSHLVDYRYYSRIAQILLWISIPLLLVTLIFGSDVNEAKRWLTLPIINLSFQTSDLAKLALIMYTARVLSKKQDDIKSWKGAFLPIMIPILIVCALIAPEDLSSSAVLFATCMLILFIGRISMKYLALLMASGVVLLSFIVLLSMVMPEGTRIGTWKNRIESFVDGSEDPYQVKLSKIAIATGGTFGKGPGNSTQRNFLPHPYSDFIYAIIIEEYGLLGGLAVVFLYLLLLYRVIRIVIKSPKAFGALLAAGLGFSLVIQAFIHMAVSLDLMPATGLPLPMVSMGGTSIWFTSLAIGIILSVSRNAEELEKKEKELAIVTE